MMPAISRPLPKVPTNEVTAPLLVARQHLAVRLAGVHHRLQFGERKLVL
jgi:hypothetical protein